MTNNDLIAQNQTRVNSHHNAWQMELISIGEKEVNKKLLAWTIDGNKGYRIQYSVPTTRFAEYLPEFENMLNSFIFAEQNEARKPTCLLFNLFCL